MKLILIRHGETDWLKEHRYQGSTDVLLNPKGKQQAKQIAQAFEKLKPCAIFASKLTRTIQTAQPLAARHKKKIISDARLNEISFGVWEGHSYSEVERRFGPAVRDWHTPRFTSKPQGGESFKSLHIRISKFLDEVLNRYEQSSQPCMVVTHGGPIRMILLTLFDLPIKIFWNIRIDPASMSVVDIHHDRNEIMLLNSQAHLKKLI